MRNFFYTTTTLLLFTFSASAQFQYLSPRPGSKMITPEHNIIIREGSMIDPASVDPELFSLRGTKSGLKEFDIILAKDGKTILLNPKLPFDYNEEVSVSIHSGLTTLDGRSIPEYSFSFSTHREYTAEEKQAFRKMTVEHWQDGILSENEGQEETAGTRDFSDLFEITFDDEPTKGEIFFNTVSGFGTPSEFVGYHITTHNGDSVYSKGLDYTGVFELTESGYLSVFNGDLTRFDILDSNYTIIDKWYATNGYTLDNHDFIKLPDGNVLFISLEYQIVDMTVYDPDYSPNANVEGIVIQEFDSDHNLIFEWRSFDHIEITEALHQNLAFSAIDYVHTNSLDLDDDGHIISSHRHLDQVTKIDRNTGEFIWRFGGVNNEFIFLGDPVHFTYQHYARRLDNGNLILYDNGNFHVPQRTYVREYTLDEVNKTATLVWVYSHPDIVGSPAFWPAMGSAQRLNNGNTFINWGNRGSQTFLPSMTEVTAEGEIVWELRLTSQDNIISYRAQKYEWNPCARPTFKKMDAKEITSTSARLKWNEVANANQYILQYRVHNTGLWNTINVDASKHSKKITGLTPSTKYDWRLATQCVLDTEITSGHTSIKKFTTLDQKSLLDEPNQMVNILLYPNPAHDHLTIHLENFDEGEIHILDLLGQPKIKSLFAEAAETSLDLSDLLPGTYLVEIISDHQRWIEKLIVE